MDIMTSTPFLDGKNLYMRELRMGDLDGPYVGWLNDPEVSAHNSHHLFPYTRPQAEQYIKSVTGDTSNLVLAVIAKDTELHIGNISLQNIDRINNSAEYAIMIGDKNYWGKGVAKEASLLLLAHGFNALNLHRIYCGTSYANIAMQKLATALGMECEGRRKEAVFKNGAYLDVLEYGILYKNFKTT